MVPNTSDDLPDPETPVNTVSRRLGISTLTSFRLFTRAPWTRIRSWLSAGCLEEAMFAMISAGPLVAIRAVQPDGGCNERLQGLLVDLVVLVDVDGAPEVAFEAGVEEA